MENFDLYDQKDCLIQYNNYYISFSSFLVNLSYVVLKFFICRIFSLFKTTELIKYALCVKDFIALLFLDE